MSAAMNIVRAVVGRRHRITRAEMVAILVGLPTDLVLNSTITGRDVEGRLYVGGQFVDDSSRETQATAQAWAALCKGITCVSVMRSHGVLHVRYDEPGTMHPQMRAVVMFAPATLRDLSYVRSKAQRVLLVDQP